MMINHKGTKTQSLKSAVFVSLCLCAFVVTSHSQSRPSQTLDRMIEALGGQTFLDVDDIHTAGRFFAFTRGDLSGGDLFSDYIKFPDMERTEFGGPKNKSITINRGKAGMKVEGKKESEQQSP